MQGQTTSVTYAAESPELPGRNHLLDVLRGIAVAGVVTYHVWPHVIQGGFLGVDVFFVLSGFLISSALMGQFSRRGRRVLARFWARRARRLLPALVVLLAVTTAVAGMVGGSPAARLLPQVVGAASFSSNWYQASSGQSYFDRFDPPLLQHLWSLAVEEQFYLMWPLVLLLLMRFVSRLRTRAVVIGALAALSALAMALLYVPGQDPSRLYFGTDTHGFSALVGALAACLAGLLPRALRGRQRVWVAGGAVLLALGSLAFLGAAFGTMSDTGALAYRGGILGVDLATASLVLVACVLDHERLSRNLLARSFIWLGVRSYGLYLWHWPIVVLLGHLWPARQPTENWARGTVMIALSLALAAVSWRYIEEPVLRRTWWRDLRTGHLITAALRRRVAVVLVASVITVGMSAHAVATSPQQSSAESRIDAGLAALQAAALRPPSPGAAPTTTTPAHQHPRPPTSPPAVTGWTITVLGDSVAVASAQALLNRFPGIEIDAKVGAQLWDAPTEVAKLRVQGLLRPYVVVALGTNGDVADHVLSEIVSAAGPGHWFTFVTPHGDRAWIPPVDQKFRTFVAHTPRTALADWDAASSQVRDFADDGIHPGPQGAAVFADTVAKALRTLRLEH